VAYQVLARKWRPKRFDEVIGQQGVTRTLQNAIARGRIAQAFIFSGPRGVGKTTTARILARALNCEKGPTPEPCGVCDPCVEIAEGRDIDVLEIDAATHTQVEKVREIIIEGLAIAPVRDRHRVFIIDEAHQLSSASFNALLKSLEEPPRHVVFMMATTELHKIPETIRSRAQEFELRTIGTAAIAAQLRTIAAAEKIAIEESALLLLARFAEGSLRDAESALDQVIAFAGETVRAEDVAAVLGLVGRDTLFEIAEAVADERAPAVFELAGRLVEAGQDLRLVCRELIALVRDLMVVQIDPSRLEDPELAADADRLRSLAARFSREDLLRAFDVLAEVESEIRYATQPRFHFEMALLRWIHMRKLVPLADLIGGLQGGPNLPGVAPSRPVPAPPRVAPPSRPAPTPQARSEPQSAASTPEPREPEPPSDRSSAPTGVDAFVETLKRAHRTLHGMVVLQAQQIALEADRLTFTFPASKRVQLQQFERERARLEQVAREVYGRPIKVLAVLANGDDQAAEGASPEVARKAQLKASALKEPVVQNMIDVLHAEITDVDEIGEE
jgi:DNA polymerase III subunit gamma/tau